jgi:ribosomal protein L32E
MKNLIFIHYDSPIADRDFLDKVKRADSSKQSLFIIDEGHRFINNVYNNISSKNGKRAQVIYDYIQQEKKENPNVRIMLLSATPAVNNPFEFALIFNLLRPGTFPTSEAIFEQIFISSTNFQSLNENTKNMFQRRILGLVSYYIGATPDKFPSKTIHYKAITMEKYQESVYNHFEEIEEEREKLNRKLSRGRVGEEISTYNAYTRQASNFVFPHITDTINGEARPRPGKFKIKLEDAEKIDEGKDIDKKQMLVKTKAEVLEYIKAIRIYVNNFIEFMKDILRDDKKKNYTLSDDIKVFHTKYKSDFTDFFEKEQKKSKLFINMYMYSPKFDRIIFNILNTKGTVMIYSNYVEMEGLQLLKVYLSFFGFIDIDKDLDQEFNKSKLNDTNKLSKDGLRWCEFHGGIDKDVRRLNKDIFNMKSNRYGKHCKIIMISPAGAEGINLNNVRQVHILEPYWNEVRIEQVIGRALRFCQHKDLPLEERIVDVFRYKVIRSSGKETADERLENISRKKNNLLLSFSEAVKSAAVDCELFKAHNMMGSKYKCFQFNEESLFEKPIGPAFQVKINYDLKLDNGLNAKDSNIKRIKIRKIKAVQMTDENTYSTEEIYWLNEDTNIVYDNLLNYPIGKLSKDENNQYKLLENDVYIIEDIIYVPKIQLYE